MDRKGTVQLNSSLYSYQSALICRITADNNVHSGPLETPNILRPFAIIWRQNDEIMNDSPICGSKQNSENQKNSTTVLVTQASSSSFDCSESEVRGLEIVL